LWLFRAYYRVYGDFSFKTGRSRLVKYSHLRHTMTSSIAATGLHDIKDNGIVVNMFDEHGKRCTVVLYAGGVGDTKFDSNGVAVKKYRDDLVVGKMISEHGGYTNEPEHSGNWGVFIDVTFNETRASDIFLTVETAKQVMDGVKVSASVIPMGCKEVVIQDPLLKESFASYMVKGHKGEGMVMHDKIGVVTIYLQMGCKPAPVEAQSKGSSGNRAPTRSRGGATRGRNAEMGAGDVTNRKFGVSLAKPFSNGAKVAFRVKPLNKGNEKESMGTFHEVCQASAFVPDEDSDEEENGSDENGSPKRVKTSPN